MNKTRQKMETPDSRPGPGDYYELVSRYGSWYITAETAVRIGRELERRWRPRWIKFLDLHGGRAWVRASAVEHICESTERHRTGDREFHYLRRKEDLRDRRWDDEEYG
jgi:hypothetical protein